MPCYSISPAAYRRNVHHFNPFFGPQQVSVLPRFSGPFFRNFEQDLADFDSFFKEVDQSLASVAKQTKTIQPRFDVKEESDKFVLNGELPGVQPEHLSIEFVDRNTMVVKGKIVRQESHGTPPAEQAQESDDATMSGAQPESQAEEPSTNYRKASIEDETVEDDNASTTSTPAADQQVTQQAPQEVAKPAPQPQSHYWVSERSVGEFSRAFKFPGRVNQDGAQASLNNGILTVSVPKAVEEEQRRKIEIQGA